MERLFLIVLLKALNLYLQKRVSEVHYLHHQDQ